MVRPLDQHGLPREFGGSAPFTRASTPPDGRNAYVTADQVRLNPHPLVEVPAKPVPTGHYYRVPCPQDFCQRLPARTLQGAAALATSAKAR